MSRDAERVCYLLHFIDPATGAAARYKHAGHYIGDTEVGREIERLQEHRAGWGSVLTAAARRAGLDFVIARTWPGGADKARQLKTRSGALYCPGCSEHPAPGTSPRRPEAKYLTRRQREEARRRREAAAGEPASLPARGPAWQRDPAPAYRFEDWPTLTAELSRLEAAELADRLARGAQAAYKAAAGAWSTSEYDTRFDTALEADMAARKAARETAEIHGRDPAEPVDEWAELVRQAEQAGAEAVSQTARAQASAGASIEHIERHSADTAAWLFSEATTPEGEAFARGYDETARSMAAELREVQRPEPDRTPGAPHPDPRLASHGWHVGEHGLYTRRQAAAPAPQAEIEREAG